MNEINNKINRLKKERLEERTKDQMNERMR